MKFNVCGIGEVLWDVLPTGKKLGGAPANFAYHAAALGAEARVISRVGRDELGRELLDRLAALGLSTDAIETDPSAPTSTVSVKLDAHGHPDYIIHEPVAWDNLGGEAAARAVVARANAICFGTLAQRREPARSTIRSLVKFAPREALRILDVNLRQHYYSPELLDHSLRLANVLKVNATELPTLAEILDLPGDDRAQIARLAECYSLVVIACTRGSRGSLLFREGRWSDHPGIPTKVADTIGAGDAFTSAMTLGLLTGWDLDQINERANRVASFVASCSGATPPIPRNLNQLFENLK